MEKKFKKLSMLLVVTTFLFLGIKNSYAEDEKKQLNKWNYNLFNPTPKEFMREMATDRPYRTEGINTIDAGHFQIETDLVSLSTDDKGLKQKYNFNNMNLKLGLTNGIDFQLIVPTYNMSIINEGSKSSTAMGFGNIITRLKFNIFGNENHSSNGMSIMPYVKYPTGQEQFTNKMVEGGLIVPFAFALPWDIDGGVMAKLDFKKNETDNNYHVEYINSFAFSREMIKNFKIYFGVYSLSSMEENSKWKATFDSGIVYQFTDNFKLDLGLNTGITPTSDKFNPFLGLSWRI
ncbi:MAG: transporter [Cyanobacteriota bacterium]